MQENKEKKYVFFKDSDKFIKERLTRKDYNFGFVLEMYVDLDNKLTANEKGVFTASLIRDIFEKIKGHDFEELNLENQKAMYRCLSGKLENFNTNELHVMNNKSYSHKVNIVILGVIENILDSEFKLLLIKNRFDEVLETLNEHDGLLGCNRLSGGSHDMGTKLITLEFDVHEIYESGVGDIGTI